MDFIKNIFCFLVSISVLTRNVLNEFYVRPFYPKLLINQIYDIGYKSLPIIFAVSVATGLVLTLQLGLTLEAYGLIIYVPRIAALSIFRELSPVFTGIILAGRVGAGIAAEIGAMKVSEQIDAIRALGTSVTKRIVIPRVLGAMIAIPIVTLFSCAISYLFSAIGAAYELHIDLMTYTHYFFMVLDIRDFFPILVKPIFFSYLITITACHFGLSVSRKDGGVGEATTMSVVYSSVLIVLSNFILTKLFWIIR